MSAEAIVPQSYYSPILRDSSSARRISLVERNATIGESRGGIMKELLSMSDGVRVCSRLHAVVHEFRSAHETITADSKKRSEIIASHPVDRAPSEAAAAITRLSTPATYAELRHGGRLLSPYPPLEESELVSLCQEIRAALVWKTQACDA
jgi:hypothetical protein